MTQVLVTGGNGFVGEAIVRELLKTTVWHVLVLTRANAHWPFEVCERLEQVIGDMRDADSLDDALKGVTGVIHVAARKNDERDSEAVNVGGARTLAAACEKHGIKWIVNISTQSTRLERKGMYARTKLQADEILHAGKTPVTTLRCSVVYHDLKGGIFGTMMGFSKLPIIPVIGSGEIRFWPIHRDDVATMVVHAAKAENLRGNTYDVGGPDGISFNALLSEMLRRQGLSKPFFHIPIPIALFIARVFLLLPKSPVTVSNVLGAAEDIEVDPLPAMRDLQTTPRALKTGLDALFPTLPDSKDTQEGRLLLKYVFSAVDSRTQLHSGLIERYYAALHAFDVPSHHLSKTVLRFPFLLGGIDAISKLKWPECILQRKLLIAAAIIETDPISAETLLPQNRSKISLFISLVWLTLRSIFKIIIGCGLLLHPAGLKRNAGC